MLGVIQGDSLLMEPGFRQLLPAHLRRPTSSGLCHEVGAQYSTVLPRSSQKVILQKKKNPPHTPLIFHLLLLWLKCLMKSHDANQPNYF